MSSLELLKGKGLIHHKITKYLNQRKHFSNVALIDGDILVYRCGFASEKNYRDVHDEQGNHITTFRYKRDADNFLKEHEGFYVKERSVVDSLRNTLHTVKVTINTILERTRSGSYVVYLSGRTNFRNEVAKTAVYKGTRPGVKPQRYDQIRDYLLRAWRGVIVEGIEADDMMGIEARKSPNDRIIATLDKDLDVVPGLHYNWVNDDLYCVTEIEALRNFWKQMITGDTIDNIIGLYRKGPAYARKLLDNVDDPEKMRELVWQEYQDSLGDDAESRFNENMSLLWILQSEEERHGKDV